jgi:hypothetical protein
MKAVKVQDSKNRKASSFMPEATSAPLAIPKSRKSITKTLATGQKITLTPQDDKLLKTIYDYLSGFAKRKTIEANIDACKIEVAKLNHDLPPKARLLVNTAQNDLPARELEIAFANESEEERMKLEAMVEEYYAAKEMLRQHDERLKIHLVVNHKISFEDIECVVKLFGCHMSKKQIDQMIWEVNEQNDQHVDYDELQLTYSRNIADTTGCEPSSFFHLLDFMIFDGISHKGYIIEDDCMEILYARHGGVSLEKEMKLLFGGKLRAEGGDGTLILKEYLESVLARTGKRALVF